MKPLNQTEAETLKTLLARAVRNYQLALCVASPLQPGDTDEFSNGDRMDGNVVTSDEWRVEMGGRQDFVEATETFDGEERPQVEIYLDDHAINTLFGSNAAQA